MKKNIYSLVTFLVIFLSSNIKADKWEDKLRKFTAGIGRNLSDINRNLPRQAQEFPYQTSIPAHVISKVFYNDKELAARYVKHASFYAKKNNRTWVSDNAIDHVVYPFVDTAVGLGMNKINEIEAVHVFAENISENNRKFLANSVQLITSAGIVKFIRLETDKGFGSIDSHDIKNFGKSCAAQVGCDVADEFIIKPTVKAIVGDTDSWTGWGLRGVGNFILSSYIIGKVSEY